MITGASSGIGRALAIAYSKPGVNLFLCGRNDKNLNATKKLCEELKANVSLEIFDIKNEAAARSYVEKIEKEHAIELVIANAGISAGTASGTESFAQVKEIFDINLGGVLNIIHPVIEMMKIRKRGQIAIISSLAGFRGLPSSPAYSASKAAVRVYAEGLRGNLMNFGIKVNAICPGYIKTPMTDVNDFPMPFIMSSEKCAEIIKRGLEKNKSRIAFPFLLYFVIWLATLLSTRLTDPIFSRLPGKQSINAKAGVGF